MKFVVLANAAATLFMCGAIWIIQSVHYNLFDRVGRDAFAAYEAAHTSLITPIVGLPMLIEAVTALLLLFERPPQVPALVPIIGFALVAVIWLSTLLLQIPQHNVLSGGYDEAAYRALIGTNWIRTLAWTVRGVLTLWMVAALIAI